MGRTGWTRRRALLASGAAAACALTGCSNGRPEVRGAATVAGADPAKAEKALRARLSARSTALAGTYDAVLARHPSLAERLGPLRAAVAAHAEALGGRKPAPSAAASPSGSASGSASPSVAASPSKAAPPAVSATPVAGGSVPDDPRAALTELAAAERRTADAHTEALLDAEPELARLLASVAAAGAAHAYLLTKGETP
ncbi:hypothetical protein [Streptomyces sp. NPDC005805]|uniref:hypothetical protein n=1 Tax=Streptomyces sp. NPDC005805 TaxID=3157068 RepID=UPI0033EF15A9